MKRNSISTVLVTFFCFLSSSVMANNGVILSKGYLIYINNTWFFQPALNQHELFESLNNSSFRIDLGTDGFNDAMLFIRDSLDSFSIVEVEYKHLSQTIITGDIKYVFCELGYKNTFMIKNQNLHPCLYEIYHDNKIYNLGCFFFRPEILSFKKI